MSIYQNRHRTNRAHLKCLFLPLIAKQLHHMPPISFDSLTFPPKLPHVHSFIRITLILWALVSPGRDTNRKRVPARKWFRVCDVRAISPSQRWWWWWWWRWQWQRRQNFNLNHFKCQKLWTKMFCALISPYYNISRSACVCFVSRTQWCFEIKTNTNGSKCHEWFNIFTPRGCVFVSRA